MSGKIILNLAISLDGYIADENGGFEWIVGDGSNKLNTIKKWDYSEFLKNIDVVVMGKNCFNQKFHNDFKKKEVYIATSEPMTDYDNIHFISNNICKTIIDLKNKNMNIFLFGGGILIDNFIKANIIDEYIIGIIPTILGNGIPLFLENNPKIDLHLEYCSIENGITILKYSKRKI